MAPAPTTFARPPPRCAAGLDDPHLDRLCDLLTAATADAMAATIVVARPVNSQADHCVAATGTAGIRVRGLAMVALL